MRWRNIVSALRVRFSVTDTTPFSATRRKPNPWVIAGVAVIHVALFYGLIRALAPGAVQSVERSVVSAFTVTVTTPPDPPPPPSLEEAEEEPAAEGAQGDPGREAVPQPVTAPSPPQPLRRDPPAPRASSTGTETRSGATAEGDGTGAAGSGDGTGSGRSGSGQGSGGDGGGALTRPSVRSGSIDAVRDFPPPPGGRDVRAGTSVTVLFTVGPDGRAYDCSVAQPGPDPQTNALVCPLVVERIRFNPARNAQGEPVAARYGWRQEFFRARR